MFDNVPSEGAFSQYLDIVDDQDKMATVRQMLIDSDKEISNDISNSDSAGSSKKPEPQKKRRDPSTMQIINGYITFGDETESK